MTRSQEEYLFNTFKELYNDFPKGDCLRGERPDFVINTREKRIGVEVTQIFIDNYLDESLNEKRKESLHFKFGVSLFEKLSPIMPFKFVLSIDFSSKDFSVNEIDRIIINCNKYFKNLQLLELIPPLYIENFGQLPEEIKGIDLFTYPSLKKSFYSESAAGVIPAMTLRHLNIILSKKEKALMKYRHCDEHWLLIEEGTFLADSFGDILIDDFSTDFDKVFLYRHSRRKLMQLK